MEIVYQKDNLCIHRNVWVSSRAFMNRFYLQQFFSLDYNTRVLTVDINYDCGYSEELVVTHHPPNLPTKGGAR